MSKNRIAGVAYVKYSTTSGNSSQLAIKGSWVSNIDSFEREGIAGQDGVHGYKEMPIVPYMSGDCSYLPSVSLEDLADICDATVTLELANGKVHMLRNAWTAESRETDTAEGQFALKFEGLSGEELR